MKLFARLIAFNAMFCAMIILSGCGGDGRPSIVEVQGSLTLDGAPLEGAQIGFAPVDSGDYKRASRATSDASGNFVVGTYAMDDGIPPGKYQVTVIKKELVGELPENYNSEDPSANSKPVKYKWITPQKYGSLEESGLTVEVTSKGMSPATIALSSDGEQPFVETVGGRAANEP